MVEITVVVDGTCDPNPGPGGIGCVVIANESWEIARGTVQKTTNNRMELSAAIVALRGLEGHHCIRVLSDSRYLVETMQGNWKKKTNLGLWATLEDVVSSHEVTWEWIPRTDARMQRPHELANAGLKHALNRRA